MFPYTRLPWPFS